MHDGRAIGVLEAAWHAPHAWTEDELTILEMTASQAAVAIHNADVMAESERWAAQLGLVQASVSRLNRLNTVESVGRAVVEETRRVVDYHNCRVYLLAPPDLLEPIAFRGEVGTYTEIPAELLRTRVGVGFTGWVALHDEPLLVDDANLDPRAAQIPGTDDIDESMVVVPMHFDDRLIGVLTLSKVGLRQFDERDLRLMSVLADAAGTAIESARAFEELRRREREMRSLLELSSEVAQTLDPLQGCRPDRRPCGPRPPGRPGDDQPVGPRARHRAHAGGLPPRPVARARLPARSLPGHPARPGRPGRRASTSSMPPAPTRPRCGSCVRSACPRGSWSRWSRSASRSG